jgi:hypothetical protein
VIVKDKSSREQKVKENGDVGEGGIKSGRDTRCNEVQKWFSGRGLRG